MAKIKAARLGMEAANKHFCEVTLDGAADVVCRGETKARARAKAAAYCKEHYGEALQDRHFPADQRPEPAAPKEKKKPEPKADGKKPGEEDPPAKDSQDPPPFVPEQDAAKAEAEAEAEAAKKGKSKK
jgi:hypothetical protein